jgi:hypothetical protein
LRQANVAGVLRIQQTAHSRFVIRPVECAQATVIVGHDD